MNKKNLLTLIGSLVSLITLAQDPQFSQFYAAPLYMNPAFAGSSMAPRLIANYRNQWPSLDANFVTSAVSADLYFDKVNSGLGLLVVNDTQGFSKLKRTQVNLQYSYGFRLSEGTTIKLGVQGGQHFSNVDDYGLIYGYQQSGSAFLPVTTDPISGNIQRSINYLNFGGGVLLYNDKSWFGFSGHNVNRPNVSMINADSRLPVKYSAHGGVNIPIRTAMFNGRAAGAGKELIATPAFNFKKQGKFSQLDAGLYLTYSPVTIGAWYRGIPIKQLNSGAKNNDAVIALIGFRQDAFSIGYSYDITVSNLGFSTGGAHELSISYQFDAFEPEPKRSRRRNKELSCPKF
ncbi:MAG: type IX secretion system membrane protein PorP/SprF [Spirosomataceae bacterium]